MIVGSFQKTPDEVKDFDIDWAERLDEGDTIANSELEEIGSPADLTVTPDSPEWTESVVKVLVSGGTAGQVYEIKNTITTTEGRTFEASILIRVSSIVVGENSYVSLEDADRYHAMRENTAWMSKNGGAREAALVRASQYIDNEYRGRWQGYATSDVQALAWPRTGAYNEDGVIIDASTIPMVVVHATCEAALREAVTPGAMQPDLERGGAIKSVRAGSVGVEYADSASMFTTFSIIDNLLGGLVSSRYSVKLVRS